MCKTRKLWLYLLTLIFVSAIAFTAANGLSKDVAAKVISPYESGVSLSVSYDDGDLILTTTELSGYTYQYWIRKQVPTDTAADSLAKNQSIWVIVGEGFGSYSQSQDVSYIDDNEEVKPDPSYINADGNYEVMVRVKDTKDTPETEDDVIVDELYQACTSAEVGLVTISSIEIDGKAITDDYVVVNKADLLDITVNANLVGLTYGLYYGKTPLASDTADGKTGEFLGVDLNAAGSPFVDGLHIITVKAIGANTATKQISLYVYDGYAASERPEITGLEGKTEGGVTTFEMYVRYADGSSILLTDVDNYSFSLTSGGADCTQGTPFAQSGEYSEYIDYIPFTANYDKYKIGEEYAGNDKYGIYYTVGYAARNSASGSINGYDDKIIQYYENVRTASLEIDYDDDEGTYTITANGSIGTVAQENAVAAADLKYAFYREDASGWVLIRDYPKAGEGSGNILTWTPQRDGIYNIQARIKDINAGSYEMAKTITLTVGSNALTGTFGVQIYDETDKLVGSDLVEDNSLVVGKAYKVKATSSQALDLLYMFTLTTDNLGTVYLNKFSPTPYIMFIPNKADDSFTITARFLSNSRYGFKDISKNVYINSGFEAEIVGAKDIELSKNEADYDFMQGVSATIVGGGSIAVTVDSSDVQFGVAGAYTIVYSAGLSSLEKTVTIIDYDLYYRQNFVQEEFLSQFTPDSEDSVLTFQAAVADSGGSIKDALKFTHAAGVQKAFSMKPELIAGAKAQGFTSLRFRYFTITPNPSIDKQVVVYKKPTYPWTQMAYRNDTQATWLDLRVDITTFESNEYLSFASNPAELYVSEITFLGKKMEDIDLTQNLVQEQYMDTLWVIGSNHDSGFTYEENVTIGTKTKNAYKIYNSARINSGTTRGAITLQPDVILAAKNAGYIKLTFNYVTIDDGGENGAIVVGYRYNFNAQATPNIPRVYTNNRWATGATSWTTFTFDLNTYEDGAGQLFTAHSTTFYIADVKFS